MMQVSIWNVNGNVRVVRVHASAIDESNAARFAAEVQPEVEKGHVILDLDEVSTIDALGLSMLAKLLARAAQQRIRLVICGLAPQPRLAFRLLRLGAIFHVQDSVESALTACGVAFQTPSAQLEAS